MFPLHLLKYTTKHCKQKRSNLFHVAGMGYRKAIEFLIKDYLLYLCPADKEKIEKMSLSNCISNKLENEKLKVVASRATWIANDFVHYTRKYTDKDIGDIKRFIDACVYWIMTELITDEASGIQ